MATGKYLRLEEARNSGKFERFSKEYKSTGDAANSAAPLAQDVIRGRIANEKNTITAFVSRTFLVRS